jgi:hypothetical protein
VDATKTMETLNASAEAANEAAETALLASESIIALSNKVSDEVREAVQQAIESTLPTSAAAQPATAIDTTALIDELRGTLQQTLAAAPQPASAEFDTAPLVDEVRNTIQLAIKRALPPPAVEEEESTSLLERAPLIAGVLTLCGVGYVTLQNDALTAQIEGQRQQISAIEEQLQINVGESGTQVMLLAEQNQRIEEAIQSLASKPAKTEAAAADGEQSAEMVALEQVTDQIQTLQQTLEQIQLASAAQAQTESHADTTATAAAEPVTTTGVTLDGLRTTLQQELSPLHQTMIGVEQRLQAQAAVSIPLQPLPTAPTPVTTTQEEPERGAIRFDNSKPRVYRFP